VDESFYSLKALAIQTENKGRLYYETSPSFLAIILHRGKRIV